ncbi:MAG TPA: hypothetical protein VEF34_14185 [Syntrophobacteraceae bacterium]|nr:hypothetical protein [Syntrophobacteraceae bacterium]
MLDVLPYLGSIELDHKHVAKEFLKVFGADLCTFDALLAINPIDAEEVFGKVIDRDLPECQCPKGRGDEKTGEPLQ